MKKYSLNTLTTFLRICITAMVLCILSLFLFSFVAGARLGDDIWKQLGLTKQQGSEGIFRSFTGGYLYSYEARNIKNIAAGDRLAIAKDLLTYTKQYVNSPAFKKAYEEERGLAKPVEPELKPLRSKAQVQKDEIAKTEKSISDLEKNMKSLDATMQKSLQPVVEMHKALLKEYQNPNHQYFEGIVMYEKFENEQRLKNHETALKNWEEHYPIAYSPIIKERLVKFLEVTKDVDFDAALKTSYNKKVFVNPVYERKPAEWKQAFRAGKDITGMARAFATQWLSELK